MSCANCRMGRPVAGTGFLADHRRSARKRRTNVLLGQDAFFPEEVRHLVSVEVHACLTVPDVPEQVIELDGVVELRAVRIERDILANTLGDDSTAHERVVSFSSPGPARPGIAWPGCSERPAGTAAPGAVVRVHRLARAAPSERPAASRAAASRDVPNRPESSRAAASRHEPLPQPRSWPPRCPLTGGSAGTAPGPGARDPRPQAAMSSSTLAHIGARHRIRHHRSG